MAHITLIEDETELGDLIASLLVRRGHTVRHARDARQGVQQCMSGNTDVVITDLMVPNSEALEELVARPGGRPQIIVISGALDCPFQSERAGRLAGRNVLSKPFRMSDLLRKVEEILPVVGAAVTP